MKNKIKLFDPYVDKKEENAVLATLRSHHWASGAGEGTVKKFEEMFNAHIGAKSCVATNNGTSALHLALSMFDIKNKEVILPSLSFVSTANSVLYNGGIPIFVDIDPETLCMDTKKIEEKISSKTAIILPVHFAGMPCKMDIILKTCKKYNLKLVEDAAHAVGSKFRGKNIGTHGDAVCFSFHPVKNLAMPGGGAITLNKKKTKENEKLLKIRRWCGISNRIDTKYDVVDLGWNYYMNDFSAAIGIEQLKKLKKMNLKRKKIAKKYSKELMIDEKMKFSEDCSYHIFWIQVKNRDLFMKKMLQNGIETGIHYKPIHEMTYYKKKINLPITEKVGKEIVSIPIHPNMTEEDVSKVIKYCNYFS